MSVNSKDFSGTPCRGILFAQFLVLLNVAGCAGSSEVNTVPLADGHVASLSDSGAGLEFPDGTYLNLGEGWENETVTCHFRIRNISDRQIILREGVSTTCGCTAGALTKPVLQPGEVVELEVSLTLPTRAGEMKRYQATVHRETDGLEVTEIPFTIDLATKPVWKAVPERLRMRLSNGETGNYQVALSGVEGRERKITSVISSIPGDEPNVSDTDLKARAVSTLKGIVGPSVGSGNYHLQITTNDELIATRQIPSEIIRSESLELIPTSVVLRGSTVDSAHKGRCTILFDAAASPIEWGRVEGLLVTFGEAVQYDDTRMMVVAGLTFDSGSSGATVDAVEFSTTLSDGMVVRQTLEMSIAK